MTCRERRARGEATLHLETGVVTPHAESGAVSSLTPDDSSRYESVVRCRHPGDSSHVHTTMTSPNLTMTRRDAVMAAPPQIWGPRLEQLRQSAGSFCLFPSLVPCSTMNTTPTRQKHPPKQRDCVAPASPADARANEAPQGCRRFSLCPLLPRSLFMLNVW